MSREAKRVPGWIDDDEREPSFEHEEFVRPLILEWHAWKDGAYASSGTGSSIAGMAATGKAATRGPVDFSDYPVIWAHAERTERTRLRMLEQHWEALACYHVKTASHRGVASELGVHRRHVSGILDEAHRRFAQYWRAFAALS